MIPITSAKYSDPKTCATWYCWQCFERQTRNQKTRQIRKKNSSIGTERHAWKDVCSHPSKYMLPCVLAESPTGLHWCELPIFRVTYKSKVRQCAKSLSKSVLISYCLRTWTMWKMRSCTLKWIRLFLLISKTRVVSAPNPFFNFAFRFWHSCIWATNSLYALPIHMCTPTWVNDETVGSSSCSTVSYDL